jgi:hypothetical protein
MNWPDLAFNLVHGPHPIVEMYVFSCSVRKNDNPVCPYLSLLAACSFVDLARRFVLPRSRRQKSAQPPCLPLCKKNNVNFQLQMWHLLCFGTACALTFGLCGRLRRNCLAAKQHPIHRLRQQRRGGTDISLSSPCELTVTEMEKWLTTSILIRERERFDLDLTAAWAD